MAGKLSEKQAELFRGRNWGTVATLREDGSPHATPVWVDTDGENVIFNTVIGRTKERHLRRDPRVAVTVLSAADQGSAYLDREPGYVSVSGRAAILTEEGANDHIDRMAKKYLGREKYPNSKPGERRVIVIVTPERVDSQGF